MRSGPNNRRSRGRGNSGRGNRPQRNNNFDSSGPDTKVRGTAQQVVDKYQALAREAATAGDPVKAENYYQHADHFMRIIEDKNRNRNKTEPSIPNKTETDPKNLTDNSDGNQNQDTENKN